MADNNNRVLARNGARNLTPTETAQVGGYGTPILFTETTSFIPPAQVDHAPDEKAA
jgi:hypothetical protein